MQSNDIKKGLLEAIQTIENATTLFYQQKNKEGYQLLNETLNVLMQTVNLIFIYKSEGNQIDIEEQRLNTVLGKAMTAIEQGDTILISDILIFDLKNMFEKSIKSL